MLEVILFFLLKERETSNIRLSKPIVLSVKKRGSILKALRN